MKLFVGLGNPGNKHARNRHNVGYMAADAIVSEYGLGAWRQRFQGVVAEGRIGDERCLVLKPETYMNESGRSVGAAVRYLKIEPEDVIVLYDEIDLASGKLKVKTGGGNAGHNGLRSLSAHINNNYVRVRIGVGHPGQKSAVARYVLHDFSKTELQWLQPLLAAIAENAEQLASGDGAKFLSNVALRTQDDVAVKPATPAGKGAASGKPRTGGPARSQREGQRAGNGARHRRPSPSDLAKQSAAPADAKKKRAAKKKAADDAISKNIATDAPDAAPGGSALAAKLRGWLRGRKTE